MKPEFDIFIIGGGINGCGIARDAAGRGFSVCLAEMDDLASGTSSWSSKLIHGGLRYLEHYEFRLVREALNEREVLLKSAPHIIWPMRFILPHHKAMRPAWLLRIGLFIYDHIGKRKLLKGTKVVDLKASELGRSLKPNFSKGFEYSDCWVNDARLVVLNAKDAKELGAKILTRTQCTSAKRVGDLWEIETKDLSTGSITKTTASLIVNAAGPWVDNVLGTAIGDNKAKNVRLVQGSHIVVPKITEHDRAYIFQNADERIIFALPYEQDYTLIGTTDHDFEGDPKDSKITDTEIKYLCDAASEYFKKPILEDDIVWTYAGVRSLYDDGATAAQEATREYILRVDGDDDAPKLINIFGGKITTYRKLAESMMVKIEATLGAQKPAWTETSYLPGGDFELADLENLIDKVKTQFPFVDERTARRWVRCYGTQVWIMLASVKTQSDLGIDFGASLSEVEVKYLMEHEWAETAQDVIWRRTKLGIKMNNEEVTQLDEWMANVSRAKS